MIVLAWDAECGAEKATQAMPSKAQSCCRQIRESWLSVGCTLESILEASRQTTWIGVTDWHILT